MYKIHSSRIRKAGWDLKLPISEARKNNEVISLAGSQVLRWIDELNGLVDGDAEAREIREEINRMKGEPNTPENKKAIRKLYVSLDKIQYKPDYLEVIMDKVSDYRRLCKGFRVNDVAYKRFVGTNNGIKNSTIVFVSERLYEELHKRMENGRDSNKRLNPSKLEAYRALTCSASIPVSMPNGILVVDEYQTEFYSNIIYLANRDDGEPIMEERENALVKLNASDGFGLMCPELAARWSEEIGLDYVMAGANSRFAFNKGMVFTFDFHDFAKNVAQSYIVNDAWGFEVDIRDVELVLNTSMVKLWSSYGSCDEHLRKSVSNHYTFALTKVCPKELERERTTNYQFIQSIPLSDSEIDELIRPTIQELKDVLGGDYRKSILFLRGAHLDETNAMSGNDDWVKALMIEPELIRDPYIQSLIHQRIKNRIDEAKIGVLKVHGNYSIVSGDPYAFCQNMFGMEVTGLLKSGELYNKYWVDCGAEKVACFRAPMSCHNNIRLMRPSHSKDATYWYRYMDTCTIINAWDTTCAALNGMDFDGDLMMITDNAIIVDNVSDTPAIFCEQKSAPACVPSEKDVIQANINSFGNEIGRITNYVTSMYEVASRFGKDSEEYKELQYRIKCGQLIQQDAIDAAKGIVAKPMPVEWHDSFAVSKMEDGDKKDLYRRIVAKRKPYFMRYVYPALAKEYRGYMRRVNAQAVRRFGINVDEMLERDRSELTEDQVRFLQYNDHYSPVGTGECVMNKICKKIENAFRHPHAGLGWDVRDFDYALFKSGHEYSDYEKSRISKLFRDYSDQIIKCSRVFRAEHEDPYDASRILDMIRDLFLEECMSVCPNEGTLYDIVIDVAEKKNGTKKFVWDICGRYIINNLLSSHGGKLMYPRLDENGDIYFCGNKFTMTEMEVAGY